MKGRPDDDCESAFVSTEQCGQGLLGSGVESSNHATKRRAYLNLLDRLSFGALYRHAKASLQNHFTGIERGSKLHVRQGLQLK
jgi:hypothetical protein